MGVARPGQKSVAANALANTFLHATVFEKTIPEVLGNHLFLFVEKRKCTLAYRAILFIALNR